MCFDFFAFLFKVTLWTNRAILPPILDRIFKTVFPQLFFFVFPQSSQLSKNMRKLRVKLRNTTISPLEVHLNFFLRTAPSSEMLDLLRR